MAYCTTAEVLDRFKNLTYAATGDGVTAAKAQAFIDQHSAGIDSRINKLFAVPVASGPSPQSFLVLKNICLSFVAFDVHMMVVQSVKKEAVDSYQVNADKAEKMLCEIETGARDLLDAVRANTSTFVSGNVKNNVQPVFKKNCRQW